MHEDTKVVLGVLETVQLLNRLNITVPNLQTLTAHLFGTFVNSAKVISAQPTTQVLC